VLQEFFVTITAKVKKPLESSQAAEVVSVLSNWKVHSPEARDVLRAIEIQARSHISFWDAMIVCSAAKLGCEVVWTEDLNPDQVVEGVKVRNPFI
jgi:predicted nucleic acid-binding protein